MRKVSALREKGCEKEEDLACSHLPPPPFWVGWRMGIERWMRPGHCLQDGHSLVGKNWAEVTKGRGGTVCTWNTEEDGNLEGRPGLAFRIYHAPVIQLPAFTAERVIAIRLLLKSTRGLGIVMKFFYSFPGRVLP